MKTLLWFSAVLLAVALAAGIYLYIRLRQKEAEFRDAFKHPSQSDLIPKDFQKAAIDQYLYDRCCKYMTERHPFLVDNYTLQDLANALFTNRAYLSQTINRFSGKNFRQYLNYYRIMYGMDLFRKNKILKVVDLAGLCGFHSNTSFYNAFKQVMGEPPSHWCSRVRRDALKPPSKHYRK